MLVLAQDAASQLTGLAGWVADVIAALGAPGVGVLVFLETLFPPIPSEVVLPLAGYLASRGRMSVGVALAWSTGGAVAGAFLLYWLGEHLGERRLAAALRKVPLVGADELGGARRWFDRHGAEAVFFGRFVPGVRSIISLPAGVEGMQLSRFMLYTAVGSGLWNVALIGLGYLLGSQWQSVGRYSDLINYALIGAFVVAVFRFVWRRRERIRM